MTVYKMVDQVIEQILKDNGKTPSGRFWKYQEKIDKFKSIRGDSNSILPKLFQNYPNLLDSLFNFYDQNKEARNAIVHRRISIINSSNFFVKFKDVVNSQEYNLSIHPGLISEKYFLIRALTEDFPEFSVIDFKRIINEISNSKGQKIKIDELILKLGSVYEIDEHDGRDYFPLIDEKEKIASRTVGDILNYFGADGWEVIHIESIRGEHDDVDDYQVFFKRKRKES